MSNNFYLQVLILILLGGVTLNADVEPMANNIPYSNNISLIDVSHYNSNRLDDTTVSIAIRDVNSSKAVLCLTQGSWIISNSLTVPANITIKFQKGAVLSIAKNKKVKFNGPIEAELTRIFIGDGTVVFGADSITKFYPQWWGAQVDDKFNDTEAIQCASDSIKSRGFGTLYLPKGVYFLDGEGVRIFSNTAIIGDDAIIMMQNGYYRTGFRFFTTSRKPQGEPYVPNSGFTENISITGIKLDGNIDDVNLSSSSYCTGFDLYQVKNALIKNCEIFNLPGRKGRGYGIISWYSDRVVIDNVKIDRTDRQNICIWETKNAEIKNCELSRSFYRDNILVSTNTPYSFQGSFCKIENTKCFNGTGTHVIRFSGLSSGIVKNCILQSDNNLEGVYICGPLYKEIFIENTAISRCKYGVLVESKTDRKINIKNNIFKYNVNDIRVKAALGTIKIVGNKTESTKQIPLYVNGSDFVVCEDNIFDGGESLYFAVSKELQFNRNTITNNTGRYSTIIAAPFKNSKSVITSNIFKDNQNNRLRTYTESVISNNVGEIISN